MTDKKKQRPIARQGFQTGASRLPVLLAALAMLGLAGYLIVNNNQPEPEPHVPVQVPPTPAAPPPPPLPPAPDIPEAPPATEAPAAASFVLPSLEQSDPVLRAELADLSAADDFGLWVQTDNLVPKTVAVIDGLSQGVVLRKILPINPPSEKFSALIEDHRLWLDEASFHRYDNLTRILTSLDSQSLVDIFHLFRPLLEQSYAELGYKADDMDNSLVRAIDMVLATPEIEGPVELVQESVLYQYADPRLETLPPVQKQLLRMGPENAALIKQYLANLRTLLLQGQTVSSED